MTCGPSLVSARPAYSRPENGQPRAAISSTTGWMIFFNTSGTRSAGAHGSGAYAPMPPVLGPASSSPTRLKSCAGRSGTTVVPSTRQNRDASGPSRKDSSRTG
jgi:hypothetical protein